MTRPYPAVLLAVLLWVLGPAAAHAGPPSAALADHSLPVRSLREQSLREQVFPDRLLHGLAGASAALLTAALVARCAPEGDRGVSPGVVAAAGLGAAALAGLAKELLDLAGAGDPDAIDFLCTVLGGTAAAASTYGLLRNQAAGDPAGLSAPLACFGVILALPVADAWFRSVLPARGKRGR